jgi:hypothetical protein
MIEKFLSFVLLAGILSCTPAADKPAATTDSTTPLHMLQPDYPVPYGVMDETEIIGTLNRVLKYLEVASPVGLVDRNTGNEIPATAPADTGRLQAGQLRMGRFVRRDAPGRRSHRR